MNVPFIDVAIIGSGPGGLALAQGLRLHGIETAVFEKEHSRADYVQGFRLAVRQRAVDALKANLPPHLFEAFLATTGTAPERHLALDERFAPVIPPSLRDEHDDAHRGKSLSRITLRQVLLSGLEDIVHTGRRFESYEVQGDGTVIARFADGSLVRTNLLVGADGINSAVRAQLLPDFRVFDTGVRRLAGKIALENAARRGIDPILTENSVSIRPTSGSSLMITSHRVDPAAYARYGLIGADDPTHRGIQGFHFDNTTSYTWWNTAYPADALGPDSELATLDGAELIERLLRRIGHWDRRITDLIRYSDPSTVAFLKVKSSEPGAEWPTGPVTLLGDAIHAMTYFRALGGNSAIYDAGLLVAELVAASRGRKSQAEAVHDYEIAMREHGYAAVRSSLSGMLKTVAGAQALVEQNQPRPARATL